MDIRKIKQTLNALADEMQAELQQARQERDEAQKALLDEQAAHERTKRELAKAKA